MGEGVVSSAEGSVRSAGRLMHEQVWKRLFPSCFHWLLTDDAVHRNVSICYCTEDQNHPSSVSTANSINDEGDISKVVQLTRQQWCLCEYIMVHSKLPQRPVTLWIELSSKPKWLPLRFGFEKHG